MAGKKAPAQTGTALVNIHEELKKESESIVRRIAAPTGDIIRVSQDKEITLPDGTKTRNSLRFVIIDFVSVNNFFDRAYKEGEGVPPACFSISDEPTGMVPSIKSPDKQAEACDICPNNEFGSKGEGKACSNGRLLALLPDNDKTDAPIWKLKVSATAIRGFDAYVKSIKTQFDTVPLGVVTDIYLDPGSKYASFRFGNPSPNPNLAVHYARRAEARELLMTEPDVSQYKPSTPAKKKR